MYTKEQWQEHKKILQNMLPSKTRVLAADYVELLFFAIVVPMYLFLFDLPALASIPENGRVLLFILLPVALDELVKFLTGGNFGMFVMRIAYVDGVTGKRFNHAMLWKYLLYSWKRNPNYNIRFDRLSYRRDPMLQRRSMQDTDTHFVDIAKYKVMQNDGIVPFR